ncbi:ComFC Predicted amidophosphoribosyltransferases [Candidatus Nanopelagicaceae bacterium]
MNSIASLRELIFPVRCLGCDQLGISICSQCRKFWHPRIIKTWSHSQEKFPIYSSIPYSPIAGKVLLSAKESSLELADNLLTTALLHSLRGAQSQNQIDFLVPIPSRKSIARKRGRQFISVLSKSIGESENLPTEEILTHIRKVRDQSNLDAKDRAANLDKALISLRFLSGKAVLIDDLVTTGATLHEAARALRSKGITVAAAVTACVAEPLR